MRFRLVAAGAVALLLGVAAPLLAEAGKSVQVGTEDWSKIRLLAAEGHWIYSIQGDDCWQTDMRTGKSDKVAGTGWKDTTRLVATTVHDEVYLLSLQGKDCFVTHVKSGADAKIEAGDWSDTRCLEVDGTKLYSVNGKDCWETDLSPEKPVCRKIRTDEDWSKTRFIAVMDGTIYSVGGKLWATSISGDAKSKKLSDSDWSKVTHFAAANGALYSIQGENLWMTHATDGTSKKLGTENWSAVKFFTVSQKNHIFSVSSGHLWRTETK